MRRREGRDIGLFTKVSPEEKALIDRKMALLGISNLRAYLRKMAVDGYTVQLDMEGVLELVKLLRSISSPQIIEVRGMGMLLGVQLAQDCAAKDLVRALLARGFVAGTASGNVLRIAPPLILSAAQMEAFAKALDDALSGF